ncbi:glyoxalase/bleomycin resistance protein/dioxygenase [Cyathus striatus]|nr:glyoxalase/bleomycin resistance protein/dioxygenase [Cyathus striatus]
MVLAHLVFNVSSLEEGKKFYEAALAPLGYKECIKFEGIAIGYGDKGKPEFWIHVAKPGEHTKGFHVAFAVDSREVVHQFYKAALKAGAKDNGAPGLREHYAPGYYAAFIYDLDGNNVEVVTFAGEKS